MSNTTPMVIIGFVVAFNIIIIKHKFEKGRLEDGILDSSVLVALSYIFKGTVSGLLIATVASAVVSIYLWYYPPKNLFKF